MEIFCTIYYICSYISSVPAIIKIIRTKSSNDYSLAEVALTLIGNVCWFIYIFSTTQSWVVYTGTILDFILCFIWNFTILRYYDFSSIHRNNSNV